MQQRIMQQTSFWDRGCEYYISGRFAVFAGLNPVAGNLLHHAIECLLKGALSKTHTLGELKKYFHKLPMIWDTFKAEIGDANLCRFDAAVAEVHTYEDLRYPDKALQGGMGSIISSHRRLQLPPEWAARLESQRAGLPPVPEYELCLQDVDELVEAIFKAAKVDPRSCFRGKNLKALEVLVEGNMAAGLLK
jgi:hypothetical protein